MSDIYDICLAVESVLRDHLDDYLAVDGLKPPALILQAPEPESVSAANFPALCISSSGLLGTPSKSRSAYTAEWSVTVSVWVRGPKGTLADTTKTTRLYIRALRRCLIDHGPGNWSDEGYAVEASPEIAGTLGAGFVELAVTGSVDIALPGASILPVVTATFATVSTKE